MILLTVVLICEASPSIHAVFKTKSKRDEAIVFCRPGKVNTGDNANDFDYVL